MNVHNLIAQFDDEDWRLIQKAKGKQTWRDFLLEAAKQSLNRQEKPSK